MTDRTDSARRRQIAMIVGAAISAMLPAAASAQESVTVAGYGGAMRKGFDAALVNPAAQQVGVKIRSETHGDLPSIRVQVQSGAPAWDLVHLGGDECARGESEGLFEPLDLSKFDDAAIPATARGKSWVATNYYSVVMTWRTDKVKQPPKSWADFWDAKAFPGRRAVPGLAQETLEIALLADGVAKDKLYPLDVERAIAAIKRLKPQIGVFWTTGAQSTQLIKDGEVDLIAIYGSRVSPVIEDGSAVQFSYDQGLLGYGCIAVPKGAKNAAKAKALALAMVSPEIQANIIEKMDNYGPVNTKAYEVRKFTPEQLAKTNSSPQNASKQVLIDAAWWAKNGDKAEEAFKSAILQ
ncbi:putative spermidine/putrescine transport system substrate-binding protein [Bosea sp. 62]|uniref:ABC transporter substrate-binding protein n=1 Tax=unclassified Bosea (in: a-proteobacteria) TaxID=2653178 RepID=UPI00125AD453|nr:MULTISPECIES: ABC transporter substrate-binding protein [unclassified Bosea (in: a-proteobacteria)]CAD5251351.1 putative spermidine/putrescine transport system substrate-binding protein [Bosea sp. 7B]CAD5280694.1 putative spermidine/putrescine transport system substrate-binding protein [Bosea sp. 21B]CAD5281830.1 putative spermidine/putrescine transport system substrate-binding protein [Bosea sp. 46]VVT59402.1 putative spermidine/putrescine transport system substrate-binding protein [Bosea s